MLLVDNPVLQRELLTNLRAPRAFILMLVYQVALAAVVLIAYPRDTKIDLSRESASAQRLVDFFFVGQFAIASLMAPSFTAGAITGEKERKGSLPIIMLCLPLGGVSIYELLAAYLGLVFAIFLFGSISLFCSSYFKRTSSSLVVSYVLILPVLIVGATTWLGLSTRGDLRLLMTATVVPILSLVIGSSLLAVTARRLLYPPDIGSQGSEVVDLEREQREAVGLVIQRDQFPDNLFAPPRRKTLMEDTANPVYDKEMHAELFSQGTLMLRLVIQLSMLLAIPLMAILLFLFPNLASYYVGYVLVFNLLTAPVFNAGSITSERERQTLDLLLTTTVSSSQILWGKLMFPMLLACINPELSRNWKAMLSFFGICIMASIFNSILSLFISTVVRRTSVALMTCYVTLLILYCLPIAVYFLSWNFAPPNTSVERLRFLGITSPLMAADSVPMTAVQSGTMTARAKIGSWLLVASYFGTTILTSGLLLQLTQLLFRNRWRLTGRG
jgi:ABC-type transport system involved in multi-copper enzyme maturation permease subunit